MKIARKILKWIVYILLVPLSLLVIALVLSAIPIERKLDDKASTSSVFLSTNGVHLNIILPKQELDTLFLAGIKHKPGDVYLSFGWGEKDFYLETENWDDLTFSNALRAMFVKTPSLMHVTRYKQPYADWVEVEVNETELKSLRAYILHTFEMDESGMKMRLNHKGYTYRDDFYVARGHYTLLKNCNSWVNEGFKESGLTSCLWTPFDFGLLNKYD